MNNRIKELRARDGLTQSDLAKLVNVRRETIVFLEKGKYNPSLNLAHSIAKIFKLSIEKVFILLAKKAAAEKSFYLSFYLWIVIFYFSYSIENSQTLIGSAILGSAAIYGLTLTYYKKTANF